ncbi:MAG: hypothetical protein QM733_00265 [Ilumatobacteraceae bacterium]
MSTVRRAVPAVVAAAALALGACSSNSDSAASSAPATTTTVSTVPTVSTATLAPGTTAIGAPVPIGGATTVAGDPSTTGPAADDTSPTGTDGDDATTPAGSGDETTTAATNGGSASTSTTSTTPPGSNASSAFCQFEAKVQQASDDAEDDAAFLTSLAQLYPDMAQWVAGAPNDTLRQGATVLRDATKASIDAGNLDPLDTDDATEALLDIELFCRSSDAP